MRFGQNVIVSSPGHPLFARKGLIYQVSGNRVTVLFDKEILYDFTQEDLSLGDQPASQQLPNLIESLG